MTQLEGKPAPPFSLMGSDGRPHALTDYAGQTLVIYFYLKDNTPGCTKEACNFRDLHPQLVRQGVAVVGVSRDTLLSHEKFIGKFNLPFLLLSDPDGAMMQAYGAYGEKTMYGKKVLGTIRSTVIVGPDGSIVKHWPSIKKAESHPGEVFEFLSR